MEYFGYNDCVVLENKTTRVVVSGAAGGRILEYSLNGKNAIYQNPEQTGWVYDPDAETVDICAGRFDIGPEYTIPEHPALWFGKWDIERTSAYSVKLTSVKDDATGVQLVREFCLDPGSTELKVTQHMTNISPKMVEWCYWSRTLAPAGGICLVPLGNKPSRYPEKYIMFKDGAMDYDPADPAIKVLDDVIVIDDYPESAKLGFDSYDGRLLYMTKNDLLFTKTFETYYDRVYNEMAGITICVYYSPKFCELEPLGPREILEPGESATFSETWNLKEHNFPNNGCIEESEICNILTEKPPQA